MRFKLLCTYQGCPKRWREALKLTSKGIFEKKHRRQELSVHDGLGRPRFPFSTGTHVIFLWTSFQTLSYVLCSSDANVWAEFELLKEQSLCSETHGAIIKISFAPGISWVSPLWRGGDFVHLRCSFPCFSCAIDTTLHQVPVRNKKYSSS